MSLPEQRRQMEALLRFERDAESITIVTPLLIPGWLQIPDYVRAIMTIGGVPKDELESWIAIRLGRREVLRHTKLIAYVGQATLMQHVGGKDVLRRQLEVLLEMSEKVDLRIIPFSANWHPALEGPWSMIRSKQGKTVVYLENRRSGLFLHEEADITIHRVALDSVKQVVVSAEESGRLITKMINNLKE